MGLVLILAMAFVIGLACHGLMVRKAGSGGIVRCILVSMASSLVAAWCVYLVNFIQLGEFPEPPAAAIIVAILAFPASLAAGILIQLRTSHRHPVGHCQKCGYDLTGNVSGTCPECGRLLESKA